MSSLRLLYNGETSDRLVMALALAVLAALLAGLARPGPLRAHRQPLPQAGPMAP